MALNKVPVSLNLLSGTDTKMNEQLDTGYKDMINIGFSGDQTAKKMKGYDLLQTLPAGEKYSAIFTRKEELLFQTDKGAYKYYEEPSKVENIDSIGSTEIDQLSSYGQVTVVSPNYVMHMGIVREGNIDNSGAIQIQYLLVYTFTDKFGNFLNKIEVPAFIINEFMDDPTVFRWIKGTLFNDDFIAMGVDVNGDIFFKKFIYDSPTNTFINPATNTYTGLKYINILGGFDLFTDGAQVIWAMKSSDISNPPGARIYRLNYTTLAQTHVQDFYADTVSTIPMWNSLYIFNRDANTIYVTSSTKPSTDNTTSFLILKIINKSNISFVSDSIVQTRVASPSVETLHYLPIPTNDTSAYCMSYVINQAPNTGTPSLTFSSFSKFKSSFQNGNMNNRLTDVTVFDGVMPISNIFIENGEYYIFAISQMGINSVYHVLRVKDGAPVATFCASKAPYSSEEHLVKNWNMAWRVSLDWTGCAVRVPYKFEGKWYFSVRKMLQPPNFYAVTEFYSVDFDASLINTQLEINGDSTIFNGQPSYYDGKDFSEFGFNNRPMLQNLRQQAVTGTSSIPSGSYQFVALYKWKDASGDVFYSDISNIAGPIAFDNPSNANAMFIDIYAPLVTTKENVQLIIYIKKDADQFRILDTYAYEKGQIQNFNPPALSGIRVYPTGSGPIFLPFTGTFVAGGDYPPSVLTDSIASAIYEDRVFTISKDNPISVAYSQRKLQGIGTEFNQDIFYFDVYDKRGVYEDDLTGLIAMDGRIFIFKQRSILYVAGSGPSRANTNDDLSSPQLVTTDVGCISAKSLVLVPAGIMFKSDKGIYLLDRKLQVNYLGSNVERFNGNTVTSAILLEKINEVRFTTLEGEILVYNYFQNAWSWFTDLPAVGACMWKGRYTLLLTDGRIFSESQAHNKIVQGLVETAIVQTISTPWIRSDQIQAWEKIYESLLVGYFKTPHQLKLSVYYDYELYASEVYTIDPLNPADYNITIRPTNQELESGAKTNGVYQMRIDMIRKNCQAFRIVIQDIPGDITNNTGECFALSNITVTAGAKKGPAKLPAAKSY